MDFIAAFQYAAHSVKEILGNSFAAPKVAGPIEGVNVLIIGADDHEINGDVSMPPQPPKTEDPTFAIG